MKIRLTTVVVVAAIARVLLGPEPASAQCCGDCNRDGRVTVDELVTSVNRALTGCSDDGVCPQSGGQQFPATGQTTCWNTNGDVIACPGTGQDGELRAGGALAYVDNGDGTITDLNTHLMWEKKSADGSIHDWINAYTWTDAFTVFVAGLNAGTGFAGHTDWRLPNVKELQSIINFENSNPAVSPAFDLYCGSGCTVLSCSCTQANHYWSSSTYALFPVYLWYVSFVDGIAFYKAKTFSAYARGVRSADQD